MALRFFRRSVPGGAISGSWRGSFWDGAMTTRRLIWPRRDADSLTGWLLFVTVAVIATGMAYTVFWPAVVRHKPWYWVEPGDIWGTVRAAHWILWGSFSYVYSSQTGLVTLPGFHVLLAPFVALSSALGLSETAPGFLPVPKPTEWLLIGPVTLASSAVVLFAADSLARHIGVTRRWRRVLAVAEAAAVWEALAMWGHPEDVVALGVALFALSRLLKGQYRSAGWLLGAAIGFQLYIVALVPLFIAVVGLRRTADLLVRASIIPGFLFVALAVPNPHATLHALFDQPNYPTVDYPTPWMLLAPKIGHHAVAAGPGRLIGLGIDVLIGFVAAKKRSNPMWILWLATAALTARSVFESVMDPYYVVPVLALGVIVAIGANRIRLALASIATASLLVLTYHRPGMWVYWLEMTGVLIAMLLVILPARWPVRRSGEQPGPAVGEDIAGGRLPVSVA